MREIEVLIRMEATLAVEFPAKIPVPDELDLDDERDVSAYVSDFEYNNDLLGGVDLNEFARLEGREFDGVTIQRVITLDGEGAS